MKKKLLILVCFSFCIFACGKNSENAINNEQETNNNSEIQLQETVKKVPNGDPVKLSQSAKIKLEQGDFKGAVEEFKKSLEIMESPYVRADLGRAKEAAGDLQGALEDYTKAIEQQKRAFYYEWRARLYTKLGKTEEAKRDMAEYEKLPKE